MAAGTSESGRDGGLGRCGGDRGVWVCTYGWGAGALGPWPGCGPGLTVTSFPQWHCCRKSQLLGTGGSCPPACPTAQRGPGRKHLPAPVCVGRHHGTARMGRLKGHEFLFSQFGSLEAQGGGVGSYGFLGGLSPCLVDGCMASMAVSSCDRFSTCTLLMPICVSKFPLLLRTPVRLGQGTHANGLLATYSLFKAPPTNNHRILMY